MFIMVIPILVRQHIYIEMAPGLCKYILKSVWNPFWREIWNLWCPNIHFSWQIILKFCIEHGSHTIVLCGIYQKDLSTEKLVMNKQFFAKFLVLMDTRLVIWLWSHCAYTFNHLFSFFSMLYYMLNMIQPLCCYQLVIYFQDWPLASTMLTHYIYCAKPL